MPDFSSPRTSSLLISCKIMISISMPAIVSELLFDFMMLKNALSKSVFENVKIRGFDVSSIGFKDAVES